MKKHGKNEKKQRKLIFYCLKPYAHGHRHNPPNVLFLVIFEFINHIFILFGVVCISGR